MKNSYCDCSAFSLGGINWDLLFGGSCTQCAKFTFWLKATWEKTDPSYCWIHVCIFLLVECESDHKSIRNRLPCKRQRKYNSITDESRINMQRVCDCRDTPGCGRMTERLFKHRWGMTCMGQDGKRGQTLSGSQSGYSSRNWKRLSLVCRQLLTASARH